MYIHIYTHIHIDTTSSTVFIVTFIWYRRSSARNDMRNTLFFNPLALNTNHFLTKICIINFKKKKKVHPLKCCGKTRREICFIEGSVTFCPDDWRLLFDAGDYRKFLPILDWYHFFPPFQGLYITRQVILLGANSQLSHFPSIPLLLPSSLPPSLPQLPSIHYSLDHTHSSSIPFSFLSSRLSPLFLLPPSLCASPYHLFIFSHSVSPCPSSLLFLLSLPSFHHHSQTRAR